VHWYMTPAESQAISAPGRHALLATTFAMRKNVSTAHCVFYARAAGDSFVEGLASPSAELGDEASL